MAWNTGKCGGAAPDEVGDHMTWGDFVIIALIMGGFVIRAAFVEFKNKQSARIAEEKRLEKERIAQERAQRDRENQRRLEEESQKRLNAVIEKGGRNAQHILKLD
jgi:uncharacterized membrane protein